MAGQLKQTALPGTEEPEIRIFSVGYGGRSFSEFQAVLEAHGIKTIIDVRSDNSTEYFGSAFMHTYFGEDYLPCKRLGGLTWKRAQYKEWRERPGITEALEEIKKLSQASKIVLMCAEKHHQECHRYYLVTKALHEMGVDVIRHL